MDPHGKYDIKNIIIAYSLRCRISAEGKGSDLMTSAIEFVAEEGTSDNNSYPILRREKIAAVEYLQSGIASTYEVQHDNYRNSTAQ